jgi:hypothetical protein
MKKDNHGIGIVTLVVIVVVVIGLIVLVAPSLHSTWTRGRGQKCEIARDDVISSYHMGQAEAATGTLNKEVYRSVLQAAMEEQGGEKIATDQYAGICPAKGIVSFSYDSEELTCNLHTASGMSNAEILEEMAETNSYQDILSEKEIGESLASTIPIEVSSDVQAVEADCHDKGLEFGSASWFIVKIGNGNYDLYLTDADLSTMEIGETIFAEKYNTVEKECTQGTMSLTTKVASRNGQNVAYIVPNVDTFLAY